MRRGSGQSRTQPAPGPPGACKPRGSPVGTWSWQRTKVSEGTTGNCSRGRSWNRGLTGSYLSPVVLNGVGVRLPRRHGQCLETPGRHDWAGGAPGIQPTKHPASPTAGSARPQESAEPEMHLWGSLHLPLPPPWAGAPRTDTLTVGTPTGCRGTGPLNVGRAGQTVPSTVPITATAQGAGIPVQTGTLRLGAVVE